MLRLGPNERNGREVHVAMGSLQWNQWAGKRRAIICDWELPDFFAFGLCSRACRLAATRDAVWRERAEILERTYHYEPTKLHEAVPVPRKAWWCSDSEDEDERAALPAPVPLPDEYVDPRADPSFGAGSPFQRYLSLAKFRNRVRVKLESLCVEDSWSEADRAKLQWLVNIAKESIEFAADEGWHDADSEPVEEYLQKCTVANAAREVVQFAIRQLDRGLSDHYVRNAAGRLIVYGFAHGVYIGFPGERQFEWEYALSGLQALDPENF